MLSLLIAALVAQTPPPVVVQDPLNTTKARVNSSTGGALQVYCVGGTCTGGGAGGASTQGLSNDGGYDWHIDLETVRGVAVSTGTGVAGTGTQRVAVASDSSITANAGSNLNTSALALEATQTNGTAKAISRGAAKGATAAADVTSTANGVDHQGLDVQVQNASIAVTGTVTTTPPSNASTNVAQFGGTNVSTGTGTGGAGIPRVTISNDSSLAANQSVNVAQINGVTPLMGVGASGTGAQRVAALLHDGTTTVGVIVGTTALKTDLSSVAGTATSTSASGVQKVGVVGNAGAAVDGVITAATAPANMVVTGGVFNTALPTLTNGQSSALQFNSKGMPLTQLGDGTTNVAVIAATTALKTDLSSVAGTATATGNGTAAGSIRVSVASDSTGVIAATQSGTWTDRIVGNAGAAIDAANNAAAPANVLVAGAQLQSGAAATAGTAGQVGNLVAGLDHVLYSRFGGPVTWSCFKEAITATTECRAAPAAGLILYVTSVVCSNEAATVQGVDIVFGTGTNCGTGTTALTHKFQMGTNATTTSPFAVTHTFESPLVPTAANAICVRPTAATAFGCTITGYTAQ